MKNSPQPNKRIPIELHIGKHQPLISVDLWAKNQLLRKSRSYYTGTESAQTRTYLFSKIGKCWECYAQGYLGRGGQFVVLRGSPGGRNGYSFYRCAAHHDQGMSRYKEAAVSEAILQKIGLQATKTVNYQTWKDCHKTLREDVMKSTVEALVKPLTIPEDWYPWVMAYFRDTDGMQKITGILYNLEKKRRVLIDLRTNGELNAAEFNLKMMQLTHQYDQVEKFEFPEKSLIHPYLKDFSALWEQLRPVEQRALLMIMFDGLFFDRDARLRWVIARAPFDRLLGMPPGGQMFPPKSRMF